MAEKQKIRIRLKAYDHEVIDQSTKKIVETVLRTQAKASWLTIAAGMGGPARPGPATTWTGMPTIWQPWSRPWI